MAVDGSRELLTIQQASARVKVSRRTVHNWLRAGKLAHVRTPGGSVRIYADALFTETREVAGGATRGE
jgi:excisionase family DNA binding protein